MLTRVQYPTSYPPIRLSRQEGCLPLELVDPGAIARNARSPVMYLRAKRAIDVVLVLLCAPVVLIVIALAAIAIMISMGRPVLFTQPRVGLNGRVFTIFKLRTMQLEKNTRSHETATLPNDTRITPLGTFLRRSHLDELPQLWNVLRGEMTLIGPRPEQVHLVEKYRTTIPHFDLRHTVCPGLSGWAQVRSGYAANLEETRSKVEHDLYYIEHIGLGMDLKVALRTLLVYFNSRYVR